jgi:hypothetical protein
MRGAPPAAAPAPLPLPYSDEADEAEEEAEEDGDEGAGADGVDGAADELPYDGEREIRSPPGEPDEPGDPSDPGERGCGGTVGETPAGPATPGVAVALRLALPFLAFVLALAVDWPPVSARAARAWEMRMASMVMSWRISERLQARSASSHMVAR